MLLKNLHHDAIHAIKPKEIFNHFLPNCYTSNNITQKPEKKDHIGRF